jgi:hypothetical protein
MRRLHPREKKDRIFAEKNAIGSAFETKQTMTHPF